MRGVAKIKFAAMSDFTILGTILENILDLKMHPKALFVVLWAPSVAILTLMWGDKK